MIVDVTCTLVVAVIASALVSAMLVVGAKRRIDAAYGAAR